MKSKALLLLLILPQLTCHQVLFQAPPGTTTVCFANPTAIAAFNGVSIISCLLTEEIGTPVADGTVVQFFTDRGRIPEQGRTNDGVVRVNLTADGRSGPANVTACFGGGSNTGGTTPTSSTVVPTSTTINVERSGLSASASSASAALMACTTVPEVLIGNTNASSIRVSAFPPRLTDSRTSQITASVFDANGNPVAGVPVFFTVLSGTTIGPAPTPGPTPVATPVGTPTPPPAGDAPIFEHVDSQGQPVFTDSNGQAHDVLRTRYPRDAPTRQVVVEARVPFGNVSGTVPVFVN